MANMRFFSTVYLAFSLSFAAFAQHNYKLGEVEVLAKRPMKEIGVQKTSFDSLALKENIALSMADILTFNSSIFVKSYGRATLSTVAFRGTSPSHTQVTWNGMKINNPMLGMTDFSTIPAFFVDNAALFHGTSSVNETGGGLGGMVKLSTAPVINKGPFIQYVQGIGSFRTFDEFLRFSYRNNKWTFSTRAVFSSSPNDYKYVNHDKKINIYDDDKNIISQYNPTEHNKSGAFKDFHFLQEIYFTPAPGEQLGINAWYINSNRQLPMLSTDYGDERQFENRQREHTLRALAFWTHSHHSWKTELRAGYIHSWMAYDYKREISPDMWADMTRSRTNINTIFAKADAEFAPSRNWYFSANISAHQNFVRSEDKNIILQNGNRAIVGYDKARIEMSAYASAKWQPVEFIGISAVLRQEMFGNKWAPVIPALFLDGIISKKGNLILKTSISKNHKFPSLNDLYFLPGGNPDLKNETGFTYDAGASFQFGGVYPRPFNISGSATWFDSYINDWIIWLPSAKGFFSPRNMKQVHAFGIEAKLNLALQPAPDWNLNINTNYSWTPSINTGEMMSQFDQSVGKQLPYVPKHSASLIGRLSWRSWCFSYKWAFYSQRYTMSSNDYSISGHLPNYYMSNISLDKDLSLKHLDLQLKIAVNNLFNEEYLSVLSHPMPGINFEFFISITPRW